MKGISVIGGAVLTLLGVVGIKLYGEYKYYCGRVDCHEFYEPVMDAMHETIIRLYEELKKKEEA